jgi:hypothetical protein
VRGLEVWLGREHGSPRVIATGVRAQLVDTHHRYQHGGSTEPLPPMVAVGSLVSAADTRTEAHHWMALAAGGRDSDLGDPHDTAGQFEKGNHG